MMNEVVFGNVHFGDGSPRICIPIIGRTTEEIIKCAETVRDECEMLDTRYADTPELRISVIEWRADFFDNLADGEMLWDILSKLRVMFSDRLILFTFRSEEEGGELRHDRVGAHLDKVYDKVIESGLVDLIDVEVMRGNYKVARTTSMAHEAGIGILMSYHNFQETPHDTELESIIRNMEILGGDILKIAVMPGNEFDTRRMMEFQIRMTAECYKPVAIISMGEKGMVSRFKGKETGSCITFASIGDSSSAPGQIEASDLLALMKNQL